VLVIPLVRNFAPLAALTLARGGLLACVEACAAVHAGTEDAGAIARHSQVENISLVARDPLNLTVVLAVVYPDVARRVTGDKVAVGQTLYFPDENLLGPAVGPAAERDVADDIAIARVQDTDHAVGEARKHRVAVLVGDAEGAGLLCRGARHEAVEAEVVVVGRQLDEGAVCTARDELLAGADVAGPGLCARLRGEAPNFAVISVGVARGQARREVPLCDGAGVADAEEAQAARDRLAVCVAAVRVLCPCQALDAAVLAAVENLLLQPCAVGRVPDFNVAVGAPHGEPQRLGLLVAMLGLDVREGEGVDGRRREGHESGAVDVHGGLFGFLRRRRVFKVAGAQCKLSTHARSAGETLYTRRCCDAQVAKLQLEACDAELSSWRRCFFYGSGTSISPSPTSHLRDLISTTCSSPIDCTHTRFHRAAAAGACPGTFRD
jgi:hypothetical protein